MQRVIGLMGFKGSGKDTAANILNEYDDFQNFAFAQTLKQILCVIFNWDYNMIEGHTKASRKWRDEVDHWWAEKLGIPDFTPRKAMTLIGTDVFRNHFHDSIWIYTLENKIQNTNSNVIITDIRFKNEHNMIRQLGGEIYRINRFKPDWYDLGYSASLGCKHAESILNEKEIHRSEWEWLSCDYDDNIDNSKDFKYLVTEIEKNIINRNQ